MRKLPVLLIVAGTLLSTGCAATTINQVLADPAHYRDRDVTLSGSVTESFSLVGRGAYRLDDRTGQLWVVSSRGVPRRGARISVKGQVREGFNVEPLGPRLNLPSGLASGVVLMESSHKAK